METLNKAQIFNNQRTQHMIRVNDKVRLDTDKTYTGIVTRIKGNIVWLDGKITGFAVGRWVKL